MPNELTIVDADVLTVDEKSELNSNIDSIIAAHKNNRQEINRLVFESVAAMTAADDAQSQLSSKGFFSRLWGGITGSNQALQNKINSNRAAAQYASQQTLQKLAEQNLMTFDLITAVNNKLNASIGAIGEEFTKIYDGLGKFFTHNRNEMVRMETRLAKVEQNVRLLTWQNSIEYLDFDGEEYVDMDDIKKIVCLVRDFYDITQGNWSTFDLLLLKTAMATIDIQPKSKVNYFHVLKEIENNTMLKDKFLGGMEIQPISDPSYLISMGTLKKLDSLHHEEAYTVNTIAEYMTKGGITVEREELCDELTSQYLKKAAEVNVDMEVNSYDMILDLLYNLKQATEEQLLIAPSNKNLPIALQEPELEEAQDLYLKCQFDEAFELFKKLAEQGNGRAMYFMGIFYKEGYGNVVTVDTEQGNMWLKKGMEAGDPLCTWQVAYTFPVHSKEREDIFNSVLKKIFRLADTGDPFAQYELGISYRDGVDLIKSDLKAFSWMNRSAKQGYRAAQVKLGFFYYNGQGVQKNDTKAANWIRKAAEQQLPVAQGVMGVYYQFGIGVEQSYEDAVKWYREAAEQQFTLAQYSLGECLYWGKGVEQDYDQAVIWYRKAATQGDASAQYQLGYCYDRGKGVGQDYLEAEKWYRAAAEQGNSRGESGLASLYYYGVGVQKDYGEAIKWYKKAAEHGNDWGWNGLGHVYRYGNGVSQDYQKAAKMYIKAAVQGNEIALENLKEIISLVEI